MKPPVTDPGSILAFRDRQVAVELLAAAIVHFDFFTWLDGTGGASSADVCKHFGFHERPVDVLLTLCRSHGYIETGTEAIHRTTLQAKEHLVATSPWFLGPYYLPLKESSFVADFVKILKTGKPANWRSEEDGADWHDSMLSEDFARDFTALMDCRGLAFGQNLALKLEPELKNCSRVLDVGGGSGVYAQSFVSAHPHLNAVVLEQAPVDKIAQNLISERGLSDAVQVCTGDMFQDQWPADCDVHLLSNLLHDWDFPEIEQILQKSAESLPKGGMLVIHQAFLNDDKTGPVAAAEYSTLLMHITRGRCYSRAELVPFLRQAGFRPEGAGDTLASRGYLTAIREG